MVDEQRVFIEGYDVDPLRGTDAAPILVIKPHLRFLCSVQFDSIWLRPVAALFPPVPFFLSILPILLSCRISPLCPSADWLRPTGGMGVEISAWHRGNGRRFGKL
jgi:hypothetical protein